MKRSNYKKIINIILIAVCSIILIFPVISYGNVDLGLGELNNYKGDPQVSDTLKNRVGIILGVIQAVGTVTSLVVLMVLGIKYMVGSVEEKAEYKKTMTTYLIGAVLLFAGSNIPQIIYKLVEEIN